MATTRAIIKRRKAVRSIHKITRAMEMIATVKFQRFRRDVTRTRPFVQILRRIIAELAADVGVTAHPLLGAPRERKRSNRLGLLVISSNRGLAGGYNSAVLRAASAFIGEQERQGKAIDLYVVGRKGVSYFRFRHRPILYGHEDPRDLPTPAQFARAVDFFMEQFCSGDLDGVFLAYTRFLSAGAQRPEVMQLLPIRLDVAPELTETTNPRTRLPPTPRDVIVDYSPGAQAILDELLPQLIRAEFRQCFLDAVTSENITRQVAMKRATDNAQKLIRRLTMQYNRARQTQITTELCEIMAGANATNRTERDGWRSASKQSIAVETPAEEPAAVVQTTEVPTSPRKIVAALEGVVK